MCLVTKRNKCDENQCDENPPTDQWSWYRTNDGTVSHPEAIPLPQDDSPLLPNAPSVEARGEVEQQPTGGSCVHHSLRRGEIALGWDDHSVNTHGGELAACCTGKTFDAWLVHERESLGLSPATTRG